MCLSCHVRSQGQGLVLTGLFILSATLFSALSMQITSEGHWHVLQTSLHSPSVHIPLPHHSWCYIFQHFLFQASDQLTRSFTTFYKFIYSQSRAFLLPPKINYHTFPKALPLISISLSTVFQSVSWLQSYICLPIWLTDTSNSAFYPCWLSRIALCRHRCIRGTCWVPLILAISSEVLLLLEPR
jgi:hypothetical protein